jgi:hypothetical protein
MLIFLDTEYTDRSNIDLISLGLVSEDGKHEFYCERTDFEAGWCNAFVHGSLRFRAVSRSHVAATPIGNQGLMCWTAKGRVISPDATTCAVLSTNRRFITPCADIMNWADNHGTMLCMTLERIGWDG